MAIHFISGKPGAGKSMLAVKRLLGELREGRRNIVTNLPLHLGRLNEYLQEKFPKDDLAVLQRVRILTEDEARKFWEIRGPDGDEGVNGVLYVLDELHLFFGARDWMQTGKACLHYLSQHRKKGDTILAITQSVPNVDKQFRSVAQDFTVVRNEYTAKFGIFRGRGRFVWKSFLSEPTGGGSQVPFDDGTFTLDAKGVASCYDTAQGVGVAGSSADKGARARGIPVMWAIPMMIGVASLCGIIPWLLGKGTQKFLAGGAEERVAESSAKVPGAPKPAEPAQTRDVPPLVDRNRELTVWVNGWVIHNGLINISLSDGRTITEESELARIERNRVIMADGTIYWRGGFPGAGAKGAPDKRDGPQSEATGRPL